MAIEEEPIVDIRLSCDPCPTYKRIPKAATDNKQVTGLLRHTVLQSLIS